MSLIGTATAASSCKGEPAAACTISHRRGTLVAAILGSSLAFIDGTVVNVALPSIQREFGATTADAQWVMESYALALAALLLVGGLLGFGMSITVAPLTTTVLNAVGPELAGTRPGSTTPCRALQGCWQSRCSASC